MVYNQGVQRVLPAVEDIQHINVFCVLLYLRLLCHIYGALE